jgi:hypothetical protein
LIEGVYKGGDEVEGVGMCKGVVMEVMLGLGGEGSIEG